VKKSERMVKRVLDVLFSSVALLVLSPVLCIVAVAIKATSPGPVLYCGLRTGLHGVPFRMYKFRTMVNDADRIGGPSTALNDARLTALGKILRKYKVDELPQLFNVIKGDMSVVGPRPQVERYTSLYQGEETLILTVRPGLTDYASIHFFNMDEVLGDGDVDDKYLREIEPKKNALRIRYVKEQSLIMDMKIIAWTMRGLLGRKRRGIFKAG
jgi:lipopolysaccharide/colanic/teichoic acid biosynthesis glycosyltransferase